MVVSSLQSFCGKGGASGTAGRRREAIAVRRSGTKIQCASSQKGRAGAWHSSKIASRYDDVVRSPIRVRNWCDLSAICTTAAQAVPSPGSADACGSTAAAPVRTAEACSSESPGAAPLAASRRSAVLGALGEGGSVWVVVEWCGGLGV